MNLPQKNHQNQITSAKRLLSTVEKINQTTENYSPDFIDLHFHANPDLYLRKHHVTEASDEYKKLNGCVLFQNHLGYTGNLDSLGNVMDSLILNNIAGGIDCKSIEKVLQGRNKEKPNKLLVIFPNITGRKHVSKLQRNISNEQLAKTAFVPEVLSQDGKLFQKTKDVIQFAKDQPIVLATGHASKEEVYLLAEECYKIGLKKLLVTQPSNPMTAIFGEEMALLSKNFDFLWFEQTTLTFLLGYETWENFEFVIQNIERLIYTSDLGQTSQLSIKEWFELSKNWFKKMNLSPERIKNITKNNPLNFII